MITKEQKSSPSARIGNDDYAKFPTGPLCLNGKKKENIHLDNKNFNFICLFTQ